MVKNVIITGASSGLGLETAKKIALDHKTRIVMACRNQAKALAARDEIIQYSGNSNIECMEIDTSSLESVANFANNYIEKYKTVDVLINNAGVSAMSANGLTTEGFEKCFATNYLGHFLLTNLLYEYFNENGRIINVTSDMHNPPRGLTWPGIDTVKIACDDRNKYSYSKLCLIYFTHKLSSLLKDHHSTITVNSFNPGFMGTTNFAGGHMTNERIEEVKRTMPERYGELETSSSALALLATSDEFKNMTGLYFDRSTNAKESSLLSYNKEIEEEVWNQSLEYVKCHLPK